MKKVCKKILPEYFKQVVKGNKNFEIRKDEDGFQVDDIIVLREFDGRDYTGNYISKRITYVLRNIQEYGLDDGYVIISFSSEQNEGICVCFED